MLSGLNTMWMRFAPNRTSFTSVGADDPVSFS